MIRRPSGAPGGSRAHRRCRGAVPALGAMLLAGVIGVPGIGRVPGPVGVAIAIAPTAAGAAVSDGSPRPTVHAVAAPSIPVTCGYSADTVWTSASTTPAVVGSCSLTLAVESHVVILSTGAVVQTDDAFPHNGPYNARLGLAIDGSNADVDTLVTVDGAHLDVNHPVSRTFTLSMGTVMAPGVHAIDLVANREHLSGTRMLIVDPAIVAIAVSSDSPDSEACWTQPGGPSPVLASSASLVPAGRCTMAVPVDGFALVLGSGSLGRLPGEQGKPYEARLRASNDFSPAVIEHGATVDDVPTLGHTSGSIGIVSIVPVTAGTRSFELSVARDAGTGTVALDAPSLAVITFPDASPAVTRCSGTVADVLAVTSSTSSIPTWQTLGTCTFAAPLPGRLIATATTSMNLENGVGYAQGRFRLGIGATSGEPSTDRLVDSFVDHSNDGFDQPIAVSLLTRVGAGALTVSLLGQRTAGNGVPQLQDRSVVALVIADDLPPGAPTGVRAAPGSGSAEVSWISPGDNGGTPITGYKITSVPGGLSVSVGATATAATVAPLADGVYSFTVTAVNAVGSGPASAPSNSVTLGSAIGAAPRASGYWMVDDGGMVYAFGDSRVLGDASSSVAAARADGRVGLQVVDIEPTASAGGYWLLDSLGGVYPFGDAANHGSVPVGQLVGGESAVSISATAMGSGYWVFTNRGRVIRLGNIASFGDLSSVHLNGPVLDSVRSPSGNGYYMVAADGGVFAFGDADFHGSMGGRVLNAPVQSLVPDPDGTGYWLVASDGGVFAFLADFRGSIPGVLRPDQPLRRPIAGMVAFGNGYLMVGEDGGAFAFSDRPFAGSLGSDPPARPVSAVAAFSI